VSRVTSSWESFELTRASCLPAAASAEFGIRGAETVYILDLWPLPGVALGADGFARCGGGFGCEDLSREAYVAAPTSTQPYVPMVEAYGVWRYHSGARHRASNHFSSLRLLSTVFSMKWTPCAPS
jgi:hypothetical protein